MPTTGSVTQKEIQVTLQAQQAVHEAVSALTSIASSVFDAQRQFGPSATVTSADAEFSTAASQWAEDFDDLRSTLAWMARQLGDTVQQLQATSQQEYDQASTLPSSFT